MDEQHTGVQGSRLPNLSCPSLSSVQTQKTYRTPSTKNDHTKAKNESFRVVKIYVESEGYYFFFATGFLLPGGGGCITGADDTPPPGTFGAVAPGATGG